HRKDLVFREETCQREHTRNRNRSYQESDMRSRHIFFQAAHSADVLLATHAVYNRTRTQEQQGFEESVCYHVEYCRAVRAKPKRNEHQTELRNGRVSQYFLDVVLRKRNSRSHD